MLQKKVPYQNDNFLIEWVWHTLWAATPKALEYKVGRVLAPSIEFICFVFQIHISVLVIKLPYLELNIQNQWLTLIGYKI